MKHDIIHNHVDRMVDGEEKSYCVSTLYDENVSIFQIQQFPNALYKKRTLVSFKIENFKDISEPETILSIPLYIEEETGILSPTGLFVGNNDSAKKFINFITDDELPVLDSKEINLETIFKNLYNTLMGFIDNFFCQFFLIIGILHILLIEVKKF